MVSRVGQRLLPIQDCILSLLGMPVISSHHINKTIVEFCQKYTIKVFYMSL